MCKHCVAVLHRVVHLTDESRTDREQVSAAAGQELSAELLALRTAHFSQLRDADAGVLRERQRLRGVVSRMSRKERDELLLDNLLANKSGIAALSVFLTPLLYPAPTDATCVRCGERCVPGLPSQLVVAGPHIWLLLLLTALTHGTPAFQGNVPQECTRAIPWMRYRVALPAVALGMVVVVTVAAAQ